jgi:hypothetical protein
MKPPNSMAFLEIESNTVKHFGNIDKNEHVLAERHIWSDTRVSDLFLQNLTEKPKE